MAIQFVYFDLGNILFSFDRTRVCKNVSTLLECSVGDADAVLHAAGLQNELEAGSISEEVFAETLCDRLDRMDWFRHHASSTEVLNKILDSISDMFTPIEMMAGVIRETRRIVGRVGILSNTCEAHWNWISGLDSQILRQPFDQTVLSCRVGSMKPDSGIYETAEKLAGCAPESILFLDDRIENVEAARARSWKSEHCFGGDETIEKLNHHQIRIAGSGAD